ncbi:ALWAYS EARLY 2-like protein [Drosera capensis]
MTWHGCLTPRTASARPCVEPLDLPSRTAVSARARLCLLRVLPQDKLQQNLTGSLLVMLSPFCYEVSAEGETEATDGFQQDNRMYIPSGQYQLARSSDVSSCNGHRTTDADATVLSEQVGMSSHILQPLREKNRHKAEGAIFDTCPHSGSRDSPCRLSTSSHGKEVPLKDKLSIRFSSRKFRRWCAFEWFYSAIDYPWFAQKEFVAYLNHVGLGHIPRLMHVEWGVIRSSLGRPRRFSERFLLNERDKLAQYRESVRRLYAELRAGSREGLPSDVARPLSVGQRVTAIHPKTREFHDGKILTVDYDKYRIQFDLPELGVEMVKDIECMRLNSLEYMPDALRRYGLFPDVNSKGSEVKGRSIFPPTEHFDGVGARNGIPPPSQSLKNQRKVDGSIGLRDNAKVYVSQKAQSGTQILSSSVAQIQSREGGKQPISELIYNPENKLEFSQSNFEQPSPYPANLYSSSQPSTDTAGPSRTPCSPSRYSHGAQDHENTLVEIIKASRKKVHGMVETLIKATSSVKGGESMLASVIGARTVKNECEPATSSQGPALASHNQMTMTTLQQQQIDDNSGENSHEGSERVEQVSTEALHWCLATFDMVQNCSARLHPPAEAAQLLDTAVKSLNLCSPENLSVLREIEMLMGRVKTQALTFVPSIGSHC